MDVRFEFDKVKNQANIDKHGIPLSLASEFDFYTAVIEKDVRKDYGELRFSALGFIKDRLHLIIFTPRRDNVRVISLRKANPRERKKYAKKI